MRRRVSRWLGCGLVLLAALVIAAAPAGAQGTGATLVGTISDAQTGVLPGVTLTVQNAETGLTRTTVTEADGQYRIVALPPGRYIVRAELAGFSTAEVPNLTLTTGTEFRQDLQLTL